MLYGPRGAMCCECANWDDCLVQFFPDFKSMKVIMLHKDECFMEVRCDMYQKEQAKD